MLMDERMVERKCEPCGAIFSVIPSRLRHGRGKHCSPACQYAASKARPQMVFRLFALAAGSVAWELARSEDMI